MVRRAREKTVPDFLFIDHHSGSREDFSRIVSHARRIQHSRKQRQQDSSAKQNAVYARSLVGWQRPVDVVDQPSFSITTHVHVHGRNEADQIDENVAAYRARQQLVNSTILTPVDTGLRMDPFQAFPTDNSRQAKEMVDFVSLPFLVPVYRGDLSARFGQQSNPVDASLNPDVSRTQHVCPSCLPMKPT
jgi:hypothetical protein